MTREIIYTPDSPVLAVTNLRVYTGSRTSPPVQTTAQMTAQPDGTWLALTDLPDGTYLTSVTVTYPGGTSFDDVNDSFTLLTDPQPTTTLTFDFPADPTAVPLSLRIYDDNPAQGGELLRTTTWRQVGGRYAATFPALPDETYWQRLGYTGVYGDDSDDRPITLPIQRTTNAPLWTPGAERVAGLIPSRTQPNDGSGVSTGTFTAVTRPTASQVDALSAEVAREVELATGGASLPADLQDSAADVASYGAAAQVELGYYRQADSRYAELNARYEAKLQRLVAGVIARRDAETIPGEGAADLPPSPRGCFPLPMTTLHEQW